MNTQINKKLFYPIILIPSMFAFSQVNNEDFSNYITYEKQKNDSLINFHKDKKNSLKYLSLLPNINYDMDNGSFNVGVSLSNYSRYLQTKKRNSIELERLNFQLNDKLENKIERYSVELDNIRNKYKIHLLDTDNFKTITDLYNLKQQQYEKNKITLEDWLNIQTTYKSKEVGLLTRRMNLISKIKAFALKTKSSCLAQELEILMNL